MNTIFLSFVLFALSWNASFGFSPNCNCVVFRLDDIQDYWITGSQMAVMDVFKTENLPISVGIIANYFGEDATIVDYITTSLQVPGYDFEVANHGYNHEYFSTFTLAEQIQLLQEGFSKTISQLTPHITSISTFIAPYNDFNADTITALNQLGVQVMSSQVDLDPAPYTYTASSFYHWPINAATSNVSIDDYMIGIPGAITFAQIQLQIQTYGFAAVMMHPQEFSILDANFDPTDVVDQNMVSQLQSLVQMVKNAGIKFTTFRELKNQFGNSPAVTTSSVPALTTLNPPPVTTSHVSPITTGAAPSALTTSHSALTTSPRPLTTSPITTGAPSALTTSHSALTTSPRPLTTSHVSPITTGAASSTTGSSVSCTFGATKCDTAKTFQTCSYQSGNSLGWGISQSCPTACNQYGVSPNTYISCS
jgi:peptidoglycan/xylan/chitin deacetylase (PgdA/CDA1 family)